MSQHYGTGDASNMQVRSPVGWQLRWQSSSCVIIAARPGLSSNKKRFQCFQQYALVESAVTESQSPVCDQFVRFWMLCVFECLWSSQQDSYALVFTVHQTRLATGVQLTSAPHSGLVPIAPRPQGTQLHSPHPHLSTHPMHVPHVSPHGGTQQPQASQKRENRMLGLGVNPVRISDNNFIRPTFRTHECVAEGYN